MDNFEKLKELIEDFIDKSDDKSQIEQLGTMSSLLDNVRADTEAMRKENKELLHDYKEVIKHYSFKTEDNPDVRVDGPKEAPKLEDFLKKTEK